METLGKDLQFEADTLYHRYEYVVTLHGEQGYLFPNVQLPCSWANE